MQRVASSIEVISHSFMWRAALAFVSFQVERQIDGITGVMIFPRYWK